MDDDDFSSDINPDEGFNPDDYMDGSPPSPPAKKEPVKTAMPPKEETTKVLDRMESTLDHHTDPFAPREGKTLTWKNVNMTLVSVSLTN